MANIKITIDGREYVVENVALESEMVKVFSGFLDKMAVYDVILGALLRPEQISPASLKELKLKLSLESTNAKRTSESRSLFRLVLEGLEERKPLQFTIIPGGLAD